MRNTGLDEGRAWIKIAGRNINNLKCADDITLTAESEELKSFLMKVKAESEKVGLNLNIQETKMWHRSQHFMAIRWGNSETLFLGARKSLQMVIADMKLKKSYNQPRQHIKKQRHYLANKGPSSWLCGFPGGHVWMWELDYKESWALKNWCFWTVVLEKTLDSPLDCREIHTSPYYRKSVLNIHWKD